MSSFGRMFRVTTFGESHCDSVGAIVDGCPPMLSLTEEDIQPQLTRRRPGQSRVTTARSEKDKVKILSGTEHGMTLGTPIALRVANEDMRKRDYSAMLSVPRPGHGDFTYQAKYGIRAESGGGRSSARETVGRVAAGAVAEKWLKTTYSISITTFVSSVGFLQLPQILWRRPDGASWSREEVDKIGTLEILKIKPTSKSIPSSSSSSLEDEETNFACIANAPLAALVKGEDISSLPPLPAAYRDWRGTLRDCVGREVEGGVDEERGEGKDGELIVLRCPNEMWACRMASLIRVVRNERDSTGGCLVTVVEGVPPGWGEPVFDKLEAMLAHAMLSLPATKGFEIGSGFEGTTWRGSEHNDLFIAKKEKKVGDGGGEGGVGDGAPTSTSASSTSSPPSTSRHPHPTMGHGTSLVPKTNRAGGTLGGISSGAPLEFRVAIKPVSTIAKPQSTARYDGDETILEPAGRHDACVLPRAPPLVEAMTALVLADAALMQRARMPEVG